MTTTLLMGGRVHTPTGCRDWVLIEDGLIAGSGTASDVPHADRVVELGGATVVPAFCDAHVHLPATGLYSAGMDFRGQSRASAILDAFGERASSQSGVLFGGNFEDPLDKPLTRIDLDRVVGDRPALLARADMHSCVVSTSLLDELEIEGVEGVDRDDEAAPTGYLREQAASAAWAWFDAHLTPAQQKEAVRAAAAVAYSKGVASVHEMFVVEWRGWASLDAFLATIRELALDVKVYPGTDDVDRIVGMGFERIGGDYFLDGSFGSHSAWLSEPYSAAAPSGSSSTGISYRDDDRLFEFFYAAQEAGLQVGIHAIGDAAIEQCIKTWEAVAAKIGIEEVKSRGHRIEHFECAWDEHIKGAARLGLRASVQPAFDRYWGGPESLYAQRIGWERARNMNRFKSMLDAGLEVGAGSDSTVTPLDPFLQMASLRAHHVDLESMDAATALDLHTRAARALAGDTSAGVVQEGQRADLAVLDRDPLEASVEDLLATEVLGTWIAGVRVWPLEEADAS